MNYAENKKELENYFNECNQKIEEFYGAHFSGKRKKSLMRGLTTFCVFMVFVFGGLLGLFEPPVCPKNIPISEGSLSCQILIYGLLAWLVLAFLFSFLSPTDTRQKRQKITPKAGALLGLKYLSKKNLPALPAPLRKAQKMGFCRALTPLYGFWKKDQGRLVDLAAVRTDIEGVYGWVLNCNLSTSINGFTILVYDGLSSKIKGRLGGLHQVKLEWLEFEKYFDLFSTDEMDSRVIMSPDFMWVVRRFLNSLYRNTDKIIDRRINIDSLMFIFSGQEMTMFYETSANLAEGNLYEEYSLKEWFRSLAFLCFIPKYLGYKGMASAWQDEKEYQERLAQEEAQKQWATLQQYALTQYSTITPLMDLILQGNSAAFVGEMQKASSNPNECYNANGNTLLHLAALNGQTEMVQALLEHPYIQAEIENNNGQTALDLAKERGQMRIVEILENFKHL
ncbi:ankyrin repeat domain-containing protein [Candidatus Avelusimicrobium sp.]